MKIIPLWLHTCDAFKITIKMGIVNRFHERVRCPFAMVCWNIAKHIDQESRSLVVISFVFPRWFRQSSKKYHRNCDTERSTCEIERDLHMPSRHNDWYGQKSAEKKSRMHGMRFLIRLFYQLCFSVIKKN